ncbi:S-layer homology domain-containing protein [Candidatus Dependentiae bacterium]|nr:S-layer homology domain-containing protein [Candidatus Dependentiae bacterium]
MVLKTRIIIILCFLIVFIPIISSAGTFEDVKETHWAYKSVESLAAKGIVKGIPQNNKLYYKGNKYMTRFEFSVALNNAINYMMERSGGEPMLIELETLEVPTKLPTLEEPPPVPSDPKIFKLDNTELANLEQSIKNLSTKVNIHEKDLLEMGKRVQALEEAAYTDKPAGSNDKTFWMATGALICSVAALLIAIGK